MRWNKNNLQNQSELLKLTWPFITPALETKPVSVVTVFRTALTKSHFPGLHLEFRPRDPESVGGEEEFRSRER